MRVISPNALKRFAAVHPSAARPLATWLQIAEEATWSNLHELRGDFAHADPVRVRSGRTVTIFNIGGNKFRMVTAIHYNVRRIFVLRIFTHQEYDRDPWKEQL